MDRAAQSPEQPNLERILPIFCGEALSLDRPKQFLCLMYDVTYHQTIKGLRSIEEVVGFMYLRWSREMKLQALLSYNVDIIILSNTNNEPMAEISRVGFVACYLHSQTHVIPHHDKKSTMQTAEHFVSMHLTQGTKNIPAFIKDLENYLQRIIGKYTKELAESMQENNEEDTTIRHPMITRSMKAQAIERQLRHIRGLNKPRTPSSLRRAVKPPQSKSARSKSGKKKR